MSTQQIVSRDERTVAVENASYRWAYLVLTYALLIDVMYRGMVRHDAAWDLLAMVVVGGIVCTIYQAHEKTLVHGWVMKVVVVASVAAVVAFIVAVMRSI